MLVVWAHPSTESYRRLTEGLTGNLNDQCLIWNKSGLLLCREARTLFLYLVVTLGFRAFFFCAGVDLRMPEHAASFESLSYFRNPHVSSANEPATLCGGAFAAAISSDSGKYLPGHLGLDFKNCQFFKNLFCFKIFT